MSKKTAFTIIGLFAAGTALLVAQPIIARINALATTGGTEAALRIDAAELPLFPDDPDTDEVGRLAYRGGLVLSSADSRFGGLSGLTFLETGSTFLAVSDRGLWVTAEIKMSRGRLEDVAGMALAPMLDAEGRALGQPYYDSESLVMLPNGDMLVGFETRDRVLRYAISREGFAARGMPVEMPAALAKAEKNKGLEGLALLADGRLLAITERTLDAGGNLQGWLVGLDDKAAAPTGALSLKRIDPYELTDLAIGPGGDVFTLERRFSKLSGPGALIRRIKLSTIAPGAVLDGEIIAQLTVAASIDNMEGLAIRMSDSGETLLYLLSDDNYSDVQRTVLLAFALKDAPAQ